MLKGAKTVKPGQWPRQEKVFGKLLGKIFYIQILAQINAKSKFKKSETLADLLTLLNKSNVCIVYIHMLIKRPHLPLFL